MSAKVFKQKSRGIDDPEYREEATECADYDAIAFQTTFWKVILLVLVAFGGDGRGTRVWRALLVKETLPVLIGRRVGLNYKVLCNCAV
jgi:hypothetical protein